MTDTLVSWLEQQSELLLEAVSLRILVPDGTVFRTVGTPLTHKLVGDLLTALSRDLRTGGSEHIRSSLIDTLARRANIQLTFQDLRLIALSLRQVLLEHLERTTELARADQRRVEDWLYQFVLQGGLFSIAQREEVIEAQASELEMRLAEQQALYGEQSRLLELLQQISTPIAPIYTGIVVVPLVGALDTHRAQSLTERLLEAIVQQQAEYVILDISGVPVFDTSIAQRLLNTARAAKLLGTHIVLVGLSPEVAQTVVQLGLELDAFVTRRSLQEGLAYALTQLHYQIVPLGQNGAVAS